MAAIAAAKLTAISDYAPDAPAATDIIHYGYGDARWNKRDFMTDEQIERVWTPPSAPDGGTVYGELARQLREAGNFFAQRQ